MEIAHKIEKKEAKILKLQNQIEELKLQLENKKLIEAEEYTKSFFQKDLICKTDLEEYPNSVFYFDGETFVLEIQKTEEKLYAWVNYSKIWISISEKFSLYDMETQDLLSVKIEEHFKLRDVRAVLHPYWDVKAIESHFRFRAATAELKS